VPECQKIKKGGGLDHLHLPLIVQLLRRRQTHSGKLWPWGLWNVTIWHHWAWMG